MLSVAIIAKDEERLIGGCLESIAGIADEIVVLLDNRTRDRTALMCQAYGATVYHELWRGFPAQRNRALALCQHEWVLFLDADERLTPPLRHEIAALAPSKTIAGYWLPRYNLFFGHTMRGGGWYPDHQLRLVRRTRAQYDEARLIHEVIDVVGTTEQLAGHVLHINIEQFGEFWQKQTHYAIAHARTMYGEGRRARLRNVMGAPAREFWRRYVQLGGWRDGSVGLLLCSAIALFEAVSFAFLWLLELTTAHPNQ